MQFGIKKCGVLFIKKGKFIRSGCIKLQDRKTRKFMKIHGALHPKSDIDRVYLSRKME